ncbi:MAG: hypothetical protein AAFV53_03250 [Myxococcota bacterium]
MKWPFAHRRAFLPVIHLPFGADGARRAIDIARAADADGVFLINQGMDASGVLRLLGDVKTRDPTLWVGVNLLGYAPQQILALPEAETMDGIWADDAGVDALDERHARAAMDAWQAARQDSAFSGLYFGGTAFKTQAQIPIQELPWVAEHAAAFVDVVTTSGRGTGVAIDGHKTRVLRKALGDHPLAVASGVRPDNVSEILPFVDAFLVASGIEDRFGVLNPQKTRLLADTIHGVTP